MDFQEAFQMLKTRKGAEKKRSRKREQRTKSTTSRMESVKSPKSRKVEIAKKVNGRK